MLSLKGYDANKVEHVFRLDEVYEILPHQDAVILQDMSILTLSTVTTLDAKPVLLLEQAGGGKRGK
jgi:hypothetical protein